MEDHTMDDLALWLTIVASILAILDSLSSKE